MNKNDIFNELDILIKKETNPKIKALYHELLTFTHQYIHDRGLSQPVVQAKLQSLFNDFNNLDRNNKKEIFQITTKTHIFFEIFKDIK